MVFISRKEEDQVHDMITAYSNFTTSDKGQWRKTVIFDLDTVTIALAQILTNFEIAQWQFDYLCFWIRDTDHPYMIAPIFFDRIHIPYTELLKSFFTPFHERLTMDNYLLFIILFAYNRNHTILRILLSVCKIQGNVAVNYSQSLSFFSMLNTDALLDQKIFNWLQDNKNKERILISDLIDFAVTNETLLLQICSIKKALITNVLGKYTYNRVMKRKCFYDDYISSVSQQNLPVGLIASTINERIPPESCTERTIRNLIKKSPPPYYTDYPPSVGLSVEAQKALLEQAITSIRGMFGMNTRMLSSRSQRLSKSSFPKIRPSLYNSQKSEHNANTAITINTSFVHKVANTPTNYSMNSRSGININVNNNNTNNNMFFGEKSRSSKGVAMSPPSLNGDIDKNQLRKSKTEKMSDADTHNTSIDNVLSSDITKISPDLSKNRSGDNDNDNNNNNLNRNSNNKDKYSISGKCNNSPIFLTYSESKKLSYRNQQLISPKSTTKMEKQSHQSEQSEQFRSKQQSKKIIPQSIVFPNDGSFSNNRMSPHHFGGGINFTVSPNKNPQNSTSLLNGSKLTTISSVPGQTDETL